jgi:2-iminobutanoate/2-iminopropanoate deaminase
MHKTIYLAQPGANDSSQRHLVPDAAVRGDMLFTGGVTGFDANGGLEELNEDQAARIYERIQSILDETGFTKEEIGHWFIWAPQRHTMITYVNPYWALWFPNENDRPARHALARQLDPNVHYRIEIIGVKGAKRTAYEINDAVFHTGGSGIKAFMPFGTTNGDIIFTGPTYGMYTATRKMGEDAYKQAELCAVCNQDLYNMTGHTVDNLLQMFVWYHDEESKAAAIRYTDVMFPDPKDRPAIHYIFSPLPFYVNVQGQFLIQYDIIGVKNERRKVVNPPGVHVMDGEGGKLPAGVASSKLCFTSVILGNDPKTGVMPASLEEQTENAFNGARAVVEAAGMKAGDIGHVYVWYGDHGARETVDKVWAKQFPRPEDRPARHCVVANLPAHALVGVEVTAAR